MFWKSGEILNTETLVPVPQGFTNKAISEKFKMKITLPLTEKQLL